MWNQDGNAVYQLDEDGVNAWYAGVQRGSCSEAEVLRVASLMRAAPWLELLTKSFAAGWGLDRDEETGVWQLWDWEEANAVWRWPGSLTDAPEDVFRAVSAALGE